MRVATFASFASAFTYDEPTSVKYIHMNQAMGCSVSENTTVIQDWDCGIACTEAGPVSDITVLEDKKHGTFGLVGTYEGDCLVVFRGSKNILNGLEDGDFFFVSPYDDCKDCKVHNGFYGAYQSLASQATAALDKLGCGVGGKKEIQITGHSLGAAIAALATFDWSKEGYPIKQVYTYGQPRVGSPTFATTFDSRVTGFPYFRVTNYKDAVPAVPPTWVGYEHPKSEIYYSATKLGAYKACTGNEDKTCLHQWSIAVVLQHTCDHCSYLGLQPCTCDTDKPQCEEPSSELDDPNFPVPPALQHNVTLV